MLKPMVGAVLLSVLSFGVYAADAPAKVADSSSGKIWVDSKGMTLYTFEKDKKGEKASACKGDCIEEWPPLLAPEGAKPMDEWTLLKVVDADGKTKMMWAYGGMPFYLFVDDKKPGDVTGEGVDGFHVAKAE